MSNAEALQLMKDYTEGKACQQVKFYIMSTQNPSFEGLIDNLKTSFQSGEDEAMVKGEFYSCKQYSKESIDDFVDVLQLLARKVLNVDPSFQAFMNKSLCQQLANGLKDPSHSISARSILNQQPEIQFAVLGQTWPISLVAAFVQSRQRVLFAMPQWHQNHLKPLYLQNAAKRKRIQPSPHNCPCVLRTIKNSIKSWMHLTQVKSLRS